MLIEEALECLGFWLNGGYDVSLLQMILILLYSINYIVMNWILETWMKH